MRLLKSLVGAFRHEKFTAIQQHVIPQALKGKSIVASAPTGTGKTAAYLLPLVQRVYYINRKRVHSDAEKHKSPLGLVLVPSHELASMPKIRVLFLCCWFLTPWWFADQVFRSLCALTAAVPSVRPVLISSAVPDAAMVCFRAKNRPSHSPV
jgi:hypothetical protein